MYDFIACHQCRLFSLPLDIFFLGMGWIVRHLCYKLGIVPRHVRGILLLWRFARPRAISQYIRGGRKVLRGLVERSSNKSVSVDQHLGR